MTNKGPDQTLSQELFFTFSKIRFTFDEAYLIHLSPMEFPIKFDTVESGWSILYFEGSQAIISKQDCISFSEDRFCLSKQCRL